MATIEITDITFSQKSAILNIQEDHFRDVKSIEIKPNKLSKTISAFANTVGGELYIGVNEDNEKKNKFWGGFDNVESANGHLQAFDELFPLGSDFKYSFLRSPDSLKLVLQVTILKTREIVRSSDGIPYIRRGAQSLPVNSEEALKRLQLDKGIASFEENTVSVPLDMVTNSLSIFEFMVDIVPTNEPEIWLRKQLLIRQDLPTVASVLLFSDTPQAALPKQSGIKIYRYRTKEAEGDRENLVFLPKSIEGNLYQQIYEAVKVTTEIIEDITIITGEGSKKVTYPNETLHEIITNAVLHRDYSIASDIHIRIFDNRIEIESPGKLPGHVTTKNILKEQFARNGSLVRIINKFPNPPNKDVGEGLNTAFDAMKKLKLKDPIIEEKENTVIVFIKHESLESPEEIIISYLKDHPTIKNSVAREITGVNSENKIKNIFYSLRNKGHIIATPNTKGSAMTWQLSIE